MRQTMPRTAADRRAALWIAVLAAALLALFLALFLSQGGWIRQYGLDHHVAGGVVQ